jgi:hypothetical protein
MSKETLVDYAYNELEEKARAEFETHLTGCPSCKSELSALRSTSELLQGWEDESSGLHLKFVQPSLPISHTLAAVWSKMRKPVFGIAVGLTAILVFFSLSNFEANYSDNGFSVRMSLFGNDRTPAEQSGPETDLLAHPVSQREFQKWQFHSYQLMNDLLLDSEKRQQAQLASALTQLANEMDRQRREDLQLVGKGIEAYYWSNQNEIRQTNRALQRLIQVNLPEQVMPSSIDSSDGNYEHQNQEK